MLLKLAFISYSNGRRINKYLHLNLLCILVGLAVGR